MREMFAVVLIAICLISVVHIGTSVYDYQIKMMDLNAPTIRTKPSPLPAPPTHHNDFPPVRKPLFSPAPPAPCYGDDPCHLREQVFI